MYRRFRDLHDLLGLFFGLLLSLVALTGIILNHTDLFLGPFRGREPRGPSGPTTMAASPGQADLMLMTGGGQVHRSEDGGRTWEPAPLPPGGGAAAVAFGPDGRAWAATSDGHLYRSDDAGRRWMDVPSPFGPGDRVRIQGLVAGFDGSLRVLTAEAWYERPAEDVPWERTDPPFRRESRERGRSLDDFVTDLHSGHLFGLGGKLLVDAGALGILVLTGTGAFMSWKAGAWARWRKRRQPRAAAGPAR